MGGLKETCEALPRGASDERLRGAAQGTAGRVSFRLGRICRASSVIAAQGLRLFHPSCRYAVAGDR